MISAHRSPSSLLFLGLLAASTACVGPGDSSSSRAGAPESTGRTSAALVTRTTGGARITPDQAVVSNGAFTNLYVYPNPSQMSWDDYLKKLFTQQPSLFCPTCTISTFSSENIDSLTDRIMKPQFPSYFDALGQYGVSPPQFFGSGAVSQACMDAAMNDLNNGVMEATTIRSLANCHVDGMDPSPQINLIFSPDILIGLPPSWPTGAANTGNMCAIPAPNGALAWHWWGLDMPNLAALPTNATCAADFNTFTNGFTHEAVEMLTDPGQSGIGGWGNGEIGDFCQKGSPTPQRNAPSLCSAFVGDPDLDLARYWSNADNACEPLFGAPTNSTSLVWALGGTAEPTDRVPTVTLPVPAVRTTTDAAATQVTVVVKESTVTTSVDVALTFVGGTGASTVLSVAPGAGSSVVLPLPSGERVSDITGVSFSNIPSIPLQPWAADDVALVVGYPVGSELKIPPGPIVDSWLDKSALPLIRMSGDVHHLPLPAGPGEANDVGFPVQALNLVISTGNDDLRGGDSQGDNCDVTVTLDSGTIHVPNVNGGQTWAGWSIHTVSIPVPPGLVGGAVKSVSLDTGFGGGSGGDNWNVERVQLLATVVPPPPVVGQILPGSGLPSGGQTITINGANFDTTGQTQFFFDGVPATNVVCTSRTQCTMKDPQGSGAARVTATGQGGNSAHAGEFDYVPSVTGMSATTGSPGDTITVYGLGLFAGQTTMSFGPYPVQSLTCSITQCSVLVPGGAGAVDIRALVNGYPTTAVPADRFTYAVPVVADIDVTSGPVSGYTTFNLDGSGFPGALWSSHYSPPTILFGGVPALDVFCPYDNWCTGWTPPVTQPGPVAVTVEQFGVTSNSSVMFDYVRSANIQTFSVTQTAGSIQFVQPIPAGGAAVSVSCSNPGMMPTTLVQLGAGAMGASVPFPVWTRNETVTFTASYGGYSASASLDAVVPPPAVTTPPDDGGTTTFHCPKGTIDCGDGTCVKKATLCQ